MWKKPTFLINTGQVSKNIRAMLHKATDNRIVFRPHFKTHQSAEVGELFRKQGVDKITVSSVMMAQYFASHGWQDITIAFPVNLRETDEINDLAKKIRLNLLVDSVISAKALAKKLQHDTGIFIEIDNGYHRSGLLPEQTGETDNIAKICKMSDKLMFKGFLTHAGNTYLATGREEILAIMHKTAQMMQELKERYSSRFPDIIISYGDTPSCSLADDLSAFDEIRPGNFVYYDLMQYHLGTCAFDDIAVAVACPVVSVYPLRNELILYGGAVHLSKEFLVENSKKIYGYVVRLTKSGWSEPIPGAYVFSLSQEHGIVKMNTEDLSALQPGDVLGVLPVHSCLTANLLLQNTRFL